MSVFWDKIRKNIVDGLSEAMDKTEELTSVGRKKLEILQIEHRLDEKFAQIGRYVYQVAPQAGEDVASDEKLDGLRRDIGTLETELQKKEKELVRIREEDGIDFDS